MSQFRVDIYNAAGVKQNEHTHEVSNVRITDRINQIGECEFSLPAAVASLIGTTTGLKYRLYHEELGYLGEYTHYDETTDADQQQTTIKCYDRLVELARKTAGFGRSFTGQPYASLAAVFTNPFGFTRTFEDGFDITQVLPAMEIQGESFLRALDVLRQYVRGYFRRESDTVMHFGDFSATTPAFRLYSPTFASASASGDYGTITALSRERRGSGVINRVIPFGAGVGETVVDLRYATRTSPYLIQSGAFYGGDDVYFLTDATSLIAYGETDRVLSFTEVRPITNSAADLENAANAVYDLAAEFLQKNKDPIDVYSVSCVNLPSTARVGDLVRVDFHGVAELETGRTAWLALDNATFFVTEIVRDFGDSGSPTAQLTISTNGEEIVGTTEVFSSLVGDVGNLKLRVQPTMTYYTKSSPTQPITAGSAVEFTFYIGSEVLALNEMKLEFSTFPLRSPVSVSDASSAETTLGGGGSTVASLGGGGTTIASLGGGSSTVTSYSGGGSTVTSYSGGGSTVTSTAPVLGHNHVVTIQNGTTIYPLYVTNTGDMYAPHGSGTPVFAPTSFENAHTHSVNVPAHSHSVDVPAHSHSVDIPAHTHSVPLPAHTHSVPLPTHTHSMPHVHSLTFGVIDDVLTPAGVTVKVNGDFVGNILDAGTGVNQGSAVSGEGLWLVDILPTILAQGDFRNKTHTIEFNTVGNRGQVFAQLLGRVTIQPIAAT